MNARIKQLCHQKADYWMNHYDRKSLADMSLLYNDVEKFAELIINDCLDWCNAHARWDGTAQKIAESIREHFGIEQ